MCVVNFVTPNAIDRYILLNLHRGGIPVGEGGGRDSRKGLVFLVWPARVRRLEPGGIFDGQTIMVKEPRPCGKTRSCLRREHC